MQTHISEITLDAEGNAIESREITVHALPMGSNILTLSRMLNYSADDAEGESARFLGCAKLGRSFVDAVSVRVNFHIGNSRTLDPAAIY